MTEAVRFVAIGRPEHALARTIFSDVGNAVLQGL
jgi:hypothetical protein